MRTRHAGGSAELSKGAGSDLSVFDHGVDCGKPRGNLPNGPVFAAT
jgi:hypothetical protein